MDKLFKAIYDDDVETVETIIKQDKKNIQIKNDLGWTLLHQCSFYGSEKVFDYLYPQITNKARLNMFDNHKTTAFARAVLGPSDKIFNKLLSDNRIDTEKSSSRVSSRGPVRQREEPIFRLVTKPEFSHRVKRYFDLASSNIIDWHDWYVFAMWQNQPWAVKLVIDYTKYNGMSSYYKKLGVMGALQHKAKENIEIVYNYDKHILGPGEHFANPYPLAESLRIRGGELFEYLLDLMPVKLTKTEHDMPYDILIKNILKSDNIEDYLNKVNKRDILISDDLIKEMFESDHGKIFFKSSELRDDYKNRILPMIIETDNIKFLPQEAKDIFLF